MNVGGIDRIGVQAPVLVVALLNSGVMYSSYVSLRRCSFVPNWWVGTITNWIASLIYINFD
jgi:hypothetical protein